MPPNSIPVYSVYNAFDIAASYLKATRGIPHGRFPSADLIVKDSQAGSRNELRLAKRAIARIEKANDALE